MLDPDLFLYIDNASSSLGIGNPQAERIFSTLTSKKIKKEHIDASSPVKRISLKPYHISKAYNSIRV